MRLSRWKGAGFCVLGFTGSLCWYHDNVGALVAHYINSYRTVHTNASVLTVLLRKASFVLAYRYTARKFCTLCSWSCGCKSSLYIGNQNLSPMKVIIPVVLFTQPECSPPKCSQWGKCQVGSANFSEDISLPWQKATKTGFGPYRGKLGSWNPPQWAKVKLTLIYWAPCIRLYTHICIIKQFFPKHSVVAHYRVRTCLLDRHIPSAFQKKH